MIDYEINDMILDAQMTFEYDHKYKTMLRNKLFPIVLFKQLDVPYEIDVEGKIHIDELMLLQKQRRLDEEEWIKYYGWDL